MKEKKYFVTGIGTEIGKTVCSSVLVQALGADYWKPVQSGDLHFTDSDKIKAWTDCPCIHPEGFRLNTPASPHYSAEVDGVNISLDDFALPATENTLIVEGAGGLLVPLNDEDTILDLMKSLAIPCILISSNYLGSINHTLLSIEMLKSQGIEIAAVIFSGKENPVTESIIKKMAGLEDGIFHHIPPLESIDKENIRKAAQGLTFAG